MGKGTPGCENQWKFPQRYAARGGGWVSVPPRVRARMHGGGHVSHSAHAALEQRAPACTVTALLRGSCTRNTGPPTTPKESQLKEGSAPRGCVTLGPAPSPARRPWAERSGAWAQFRVSTGALPGSEGPHKRVGALNGLAGAGPWSVRCLPPPPPVLSSPGSLRWFSWHFPEPRVDPIGYFVTRCCALRGQGASSPGCVAEHLAVGVC